MHLQISTILLLLALFVPFHLKGQFEELEKEIRAYEGDKMVELQKARLLLVDKIKANEIEKAKELIAFLQSKNQDYYFAINHDELFFAHLLCHDFAYLTSTLLVDSIITFHSCKTFSFNDYNPYQEGMYFKLLKLTHASIDNLKLQIKQSKLNQEQKDFIDLFMHYKMLGPTYIEQDEVNAMADVFLEKHPSSKYEDFVRKRIRSKYYTSKFGFGYHINTGVNFKSKQLKSKYGANFSFGAAADFYWQKLFFSTGFNGGGAKTNTDIVYENGLWLNNSKYSIFQMDVKSGYSIIKKEKITFIPFLNLSTVKISPNFEDVEANPELNKANLDFTGAIGIGFNLDINLSNNTPHALEPSFEGKDIFFLRISYAYKMPRFSKSYAASDGNFHLITFGFGGASHRRKKDI